MLFLSFVCLTAILQAGFWEVEDLDGPAISYYIDDADVDTTATGEPLMDDQIYSYKTAPYEEAPNEPGSIIICPGSGVHCINVKFKIRGEVVTVPFTKGKGRYNVEWQ